MTKDNITPMTKPNKIVTIEADKQRHIKFGMNAFIKLERELGRPMTQLGDDISMEELRTMLWVGLLWEDKKLTPEKVGDIMDEAIELNGLEALSGALGEAIQGALGNTATPSN